MAFKRVVAKPKYYGIPVVSIGNLIVGGTGKTPVSIAISKKYDKSAVILRGYGRESKGLFIVSHNGKILEDVSISGDEAMVLAQSLVNATVIVSENREEGILKAKELGCEIVFLDDGFTKYNIFKLDILLRPKKEPTNIFCLPSGGYRDTKMMYAFADLVLEEEKDFTRIVTFIQNDKKIDTLPQKKLLVTGISKPQRLLEFFDEDIEYSFFVDHHNYTKEDIEQIKQKYSDYSIITTKKDFVKLEKFDLQDLILMDLEIDFKDDKVFTAIDKYLEQSKSV